jgi:aspartate beta-hydroxylase
LRPLPGDGRRARGGAAARFARQGPDGDVLGDTIEHEAWNDSDELRAILILDVWNPLLSAAERAAVRVVG